MIYGVKSWQAEHGIRQTAYKQRHEYPEFQRIVENDFYNDHIISGKESIKLAFERADKIADVLRKGGFGLKGFTFSRKQSDEDSWNRVVVTRRIRMNGWN